jgi:hypothetical protein
VTSRYHPFTFKHAHGRWTAEVLPLYYGLLTFVRTAPAGSRLLATSPVLSSSLRVWATRDSTRAVRAVLINEPSTRQVTAAINVPHAGEAATLEQLTAPGLTATSGVRIAGQSFAPETSTARLAGTHTVTGIEAIQNRFVFTVAPASAALLSVSVS